MNISTPKNAPKESLQARLYRQRAAQIKRLQKLQKQRSRGVILVSTGIGKAVKALRDGYAVAREGWNGKGMYLVYYSEKLLSDKYSSTLPLDAQVMMRTVNKTLSQWSPTSADMMARDWQVVGKASVLLTKDGEALEEELAKIVSSPPKAHRNDVSSDDDVAAEEPDFSNELPRGCTHPGCPICTHK